MLSHTQHEHQSRQAHINHLVISYIGTNDRGTALEHGMADDSASIRSQGTNCLSSGASQLT